jgi:hypothetical protein
MVTADLRKELLQLAKTQDTEKNNWQCNLQKYIRSSKSSEADQLVNQLMPLMQRSRDLNQTSSKPRKPRTPDAPVFGDVLFRVWAFIVSTRSDNPLYSNVIGQTKRGVVGIPTKENLNAFILDALEVRELVEIQTGQDAHLEFGVDFEGDKVYSFLRSRWSPAAMVLEAIPAAAGKDIPAVTPFTEIRTCRHK